MKRSLLFLFILTCFFQRQGLGNELAICPEVCLYAPSSGCWYVTEEYLYWKGREDGLDFAYDSTFNNGVLVPSGKVHYPNFSWHSGFRLGAGRVFNCHPWELYASYTWFQSKASGRATELPTGELTPRDAGNPAPFNLVAASAEAKWKLHYQTLDIECLLRCCGGCNFTFKPFLGLKAAWTKDRFRTFYTGLGVPETTNLYRQKVRGVGPRMGFDTNWLFCKGFSLFGKGAVSLLWQKALIEFSQNFAPDGGGSNLAKKLFSLNTLLDLGVGIGWDTCFSPCCRLNIRLGWEHHIWHKYNQLPRFPGMNALNVSFAEKNDNSDLTLYGLTVSGRLEF